MYKMKPKKILSNDKSDMRIVTGFNMNKDDKKIFEATFLNQVQFEGLKDDVNFKNALERMDVLDFLKEQPYGVNSNGEEIPYDMSKDSFSTKEEAIRHYAITATLITTAFEAVEQFLKAFLVAEGITSEDLQNAGHNLEALYNMLSSDTKEKISEQFKLSKENKKGNANYNVGDGLDIDLSFSSIESLKGKKLENVIHKFGKDFYFSARHPGSKGNTVVFRQEDVERLLSLAYAMKNVSLIASLERQAANIKMANVMQRQSFDFKVNDFNKGDANTKIYYKNNIYLNYADVRVAVVNKLVKKYGLDYLTDEDAVSDDEQMDNYVARCYTANAACDACEHLMKGFLMLNGVSNDEIKQLSHNLYALWERMDGFNERKAIERQLGFNKIKEALEKISQGDTSGQLGVRSRYAGIEFVEPQNLNFLISFTSALGEINKSLLKESSKR